MRRAFGKPLLVAESKAHRLDSASGVARGTTYQEEFLQHLIYNHPDCLPIGEIEPAIDRVISVCTELPLSTGYVDNLLIGVDGTPVIVEAKLWSNSEARREVVAQALDYASCLFSMDYGALENAVLRAQFPSASRPQRLYDLFDAPDAKEESEFIDAINANLRRGRALILVVGDGIRSEAAQLASLVQSHAGSHFTFAMVEMQVFQMPNDGGLLICPRTLVQTEMIQRGIVQIDDNRSTVVPVDAKAKDHALSTSLSSEQFFEELAKVDLRLPDCLKSLIVKVEPLGVYPEYRKTLMFKWDPPDGKPVNLGYVSRQGQLWTDLTNYNAPSDLSHAYIQELADAFGAKIESQGEYWHIKSHGRVLRVVDVIDKLDAWPPIIERFLAQLKGRLEVS